MRIEKEFFLKIFTITLVLALAVLFFGVMAIQNAGAKLSAGSILLAGLSFENSQQFEQAVPLAEISLTSIIDSSSAGLVSLQPLVQQLKSLNVKVVSEESLEWQSAEAKQVLQEYNVERIPVLLIQGEVGKVPELVQGWQSIGSTESDGSLVLRNVPPLYLEVSSGKVRGIVNAVFITVSDKNEVFSAEVFKQVLQNAFGMIAIEEKTIDYNSSEGQSIIAGYALQKLPTVLLSGDLNAYNGFEQAWQQVGSIESDGNFVFRNPEVLTGLKYLDLNSNQVVEALSQQQ